MVSNTVAFTSTRPSPASPLAALERRVKVPEMKPPAVPDEPDLRAENARLNKVIQVLMDRAERSTNLLGYDFGLFQTSVMLDEQVHSRTAELEAALRENEKITRALRQYEA